MHFLDGLDSSTIPVPSQIGIIIEESSFVRDNTLLILPLLLRYLNLLIMNPTINANKGMEILKIYSNLS